MTTHKTIKTATLIISLGLGSLFVQAQTFDSTSDGSDGALNLTTPGTIFFDPVALGLDADGDNIYHFTTITISNGVTVRLSSEFVNAPVLWLASSNVQIDGVIDLIGEAGEDGSSPVEDAYVRPAIPGSGGFIGGTRGGPLP